jgi:hypothetical protein
MSNFAKQFKKSNVVTSQHHNVVPVSVMARFAVFPFKSIPLVGYFFDGGDEAMHPALYQKLSKRKAIVLSGKKQGRVVKFKASQNVQPLSAATQVDMCNEIEKK